MILSGLKNQGGFSFSVENLFAGGSGGIRGLDIGDIDVDGDMDVIAAKTDSNQTAIYLNDGSGLFTEEIIASERDEPYGVHLADLTGDDIPDLITAVTFHSKVVMDVNTTCAAPSNLIVDYSLLPANIRLGWTASYDAIQNQVRLEELGGSASGAVVIEGDFVKVKTTFLSPGSSYNWEVRSMCSSGTVSDFSEIASFSVPLMRMTSEHLELYPNPGSGILHIANTEEGVVSVFTLQGLLVMQKRVSLNAAIDLADKQDNVFHVRFVADSGAVKSAWIVLER